MPSFAVVAPWIVVFLATIAVRIAFLRVYAAEKLANKAIGHALLQDDAPNVAFTRVVINADRLHVRAPRQRLITLKPGESMASVDPPSPGEASPPALVSDEHRGWRVEIDGQASGLFDEGSNLERALQRQRNDRPRRLKVSERFFLHAPRWTLSALAGALILGIGMTGLAAAGESHSSKVTRILTSEDNYECVIDWQGSRAEGPHITSCPDYDEQRVGDMVDAVRLPASDYVITRDESHLTYVAFLAFMAAAALALLAACEVVWRFVLPRKVGTYSPLLLDEDQLPSADFDEDIPQVLPAERDKLLSPASWLPYAPERPRTTPAHTSTWQRRFAWRWHTLPIPWVSIWVLGMSTYHHESHHWLLTFMVLGGIGVLIGIIRMARAIVAPRRRVDPQAPHTTYSYVRLPEAKPRGKASATPLLVFETSSHRGVHSAAHPPPMTTANEPLEDEDGAWTLEVDGGPAPSGTLTVVGDLNNIRHPRISIDGVEYELAGHPEWCDVSELEFEHRAAQRAHQINWL